MHNGREYLYEQGHEYPPAVTFVMTVVAASDPSPTESETANVNPRGNLDLFTREDVYFPLESFGRCA